MACDCVGDPGLDEDARGEARHLLADGVARTAARLDFLRLAWGPGGVSPPLDPADAKATSDRFVATHPGRSLDWPPDALAHVAAAGKLVACLVEIAVRDGAPGSAIKVRGGIDLIEVAAPAVRRPTPPRTTHALDVACALGLDLDIRWGAADMGSMRVRPKTFA
jgi:hypothetical protein